MDSKPKKQFTTLLKTMKKIPPVRQMPNLERTRQKGPGARGGKAIPSNEIPATQYGGTKLDPKAPSLNELRRRKVDELNGLRGQT